MHVERGGWHQASGTSNVRATYYVAVAEILVELRITNRYLVVYRQSTDYVISHEQ